ncbi:IS3 family transposase [Arthrobacter sp. JCM 19049]|uniref:IS3 family transposase n=1 Tax=Arthrobacter sp. JCM 19049 TaxID=1460643 RepID=UPI000A9EF143|nr:IS3 family transposase [Arthrobacter sp. JCM 19049]
MRQRNRALGYRRMSVELAEDPLVSDPVYHKRVARLMRHHNIVSVRLGKPKSTPLKDPAAQVFKDLVRRDFTAQAQGELFVGDITYLPTARRGSSCIWRRCWMCVHGTWWGGRSPITYVPSWSSRPWKPPHWPVVDWRA